MSRRDNYAGINVDWMTLVLYLALVLVGWLMIYSTSYDEDNPTSIFNLSTSVGKQTIFICLSLVVLFFTSIIDWKFWRTFAYPIFAFAMLLLVGVILIGIEVKGAKSWYSLPGGFTVQPSEFAKFATNIALAAFLSTYSTDIRTIRSQLISFLIILMPVGLILIQPDAGSALVFFSFLIVLYRKGLSPNFYIIAIVVSTLLIVGLVFNPLKIILTLILLSTLILMLNLKNKVYWLISFSVLLAASIFTISQGVLLPIFFINAGIFIIFVSILWKQRKKALIIRLFALIFAGGILSFSANYSFNNILKPHQQDRINVWLQPSKCDPQGSLYNVIQSKMTIGSGGFEGKGYLKGTMTKLNYVPEQSTDFIFCVVGEEQGFIGSVGVIGLISLLLYRILVLAERQRSDFSKYYAYGVAGVLFFHFFINIGMTMGLVPIIGIPLPFISYGGSSILGFSLLIGVLLKLDSNRFTA